MIAEPLTNTLRRSLRKLHPQALPHAQLVDLGPGDGSNTSPILAAVASHVRKLVYSPVDVSPTFLHSATLLRQRYPRMLVRPRLSTFENLRRGHFRPGKDALFIVALGLTFLNFPSIEIVQLLRKLTRPGDMCYIAAVVRDPGQRQAELLAPYLSRPHEEFNFSILRHLGFSPREATYNVQFSHDAIEIGFTVHRVPAYLAMRGFHEGDLVLTARSFRYTLGQYHRILHEGFGRCDHTSDGRHRIVVSWCTR
jgi:uncharacterized SAM-dependent methyltransferase